MTEETDILERLPQAANPEKRVLTVSEIEAEADEYKQMLAGLDFYDVPDRVRGWIMAAYNDPEWDWRKSDGCTLVSECGYPKGRRFPPCVQHDFDWWRVRNRGDITAMQANYHFFLSGVAFGFTLRSAVRAVGVTVSWFAWFKWVGAGKNR